MAILILLILLLVFVVYVSLVKGSDDETEDVPVEIVIHSEKTVEDGFWPDKFREHLLHKDDAKHARHKRNQTPW